MSKDLLIIDDEEFYFEPIFERLEHEGLSYEYCLNGSAGLEKLDTANYRLVILDIRVSPGDNLANVTGYESTYGLYILEKIREKQPGLPVICYTIYDKKEIIDKIIKLGGIYMKKGGKMSELIEAIKKSLKR